MSRRDDSDAKGEGRAGRLAEALRQNLRRRKAQARSRREPQPAGPGAEAAGAGNAPANGPARTGPGEAAEDGPRD